MSNIEILAPAGGFDSVIAAVRSGADAVYVGAKRFSARASAHNFDDNELRECVRYCHQRDVKVYLALNTVLFDDELGDALELVKSAAAADIDALIIQDMGLAELVKRAVPDLPLHASTQMSVHTPRGAKALYEQGFKRVVVSRELSIDEIRRIHDFCPGIELEVFVHGALCMCVSGQCYFSAMLGGRSANRGMCAQPCRLPMRFADNDHALSMKDNSGLSYLRELEKIGVKSAKIEGRMKRPEYVAAATSAAVEALRNGRASSESEQRLRSVFSRSGFTDGYLSGRLGEDMFGYRRKEDVLSADNDLLRDIRNEYKDEKQRVPVKWSLRVRVGERPILTATDGQRTVRVEGENEAERAVKLPLSEDRAAQSLQKTGGTQYRIDSIDADIEGDAALSSAALNALRRGALAELDEARAIWHDYEIKNVDIESWLGEAEVRDREAEDRVVVYSAEYPEDIGELGRVYVAAEAVEELPDSWDSEVGIEAPRAYFGNEDELYEKLKTLRERGARHLAAHNIATLLIGRELGYTVHGGFGLNLTNSAALKWARDCGAVDAELSPEIDLRRAEKLGDVIPKGIIRYGYLPLMVTRNSPAGKNGSCKNIEFLQDRKGENFSVIKREGRFDIVNSVPIFLPEKDYRVRGKIFNIYRFTVENSVDKMNKSLENIRENRDFERFTRGLYIRGVK